ncbi:MAG: NAD(P)-dependent glycerol-3-phosphate dehydrogenase [Aeromicrobium sp.]|nr:NAD(P)-dependent glycerol-3-phosphate dehydrogenase [Burkholderiales bacterium]
MRIAVLGAGAWGTALAIALARKHQVTLWGRDATQMQRIFASRTNEKYLPGITLDSAISVNASFSGALADAHLALIVTSTSGLPETVAATLAESRRAAGVVPIIWACKGFDKLTGKLPHETIAALVPPDTKYGALSGPSFANEVANGLPCALTLAANDESFSAETAAALNNHALRVYSSSDLIGVELGGALKNVMAIAAGISDGMQLGLNARAALITRGLAEMVRLGVAMGGKPETFMGLTGMGDLILTATGSLSRNRKVGMLLAEGKSLGDVLRDLGHVAEGVNSAAAALELAHKHNVNMPITEAVNAVLFHDADPRDAVKALLAREAKAE